MIQFGEINRRVRTVEDMVADLSSRVATVNEHLLQKEKSHDSSVTSAMHIVGSLQKEMEDMRNEVKEIRKHLAHTALASKVKELESYIGLIDPAQFVTREELKKMLGESSGGMNRP